MADYGEAPNSVKDASRELKAQNGFNTVLEAEKSGDAAPTKLRENGDSRLNTRALEIPKATSEPASWLSWFSKSEIAIENKDNIDGDVSSADENGPQQIPLKGLQDASTSAKQRRNSDPSLVSSSAKQVGASRPWLSLWGNASTQTKSSPSASAVGVASSTTNDSNATVSEHGRLTGMELRPPSPSHTFQQPANGTKPSCRWVSWSRRESKTGDEKTRPGSEVREPSFARSPRSRLESAFMDEAIERVANKASNRQRPQSPKGTEDLKRSRGSADETQKLHRTEAILLGPKENSKVDINFKEKPLPANLLLPALRATYSPIERPSLIQQISKLLQMSSSLEPKHVDIVHNPPLVKKALAIVSSASTIKCMALLHG